MIPRVLERFAGTDNLRNPYRSITIHHVRRLNGSDMKSRDKMPGTAKVVLIRPATRRGLLSRLGLEKEDFLAVPVCLIWGLGYCLTTVGLPTLTAMTGGLPLSGGAGDLAYAVAAAVTVPIDLVRQLLA
jgi:hypothetical protein